jgi:hypothetical protein
MTEQQVCEAADYGMSDCENLATTTVSIDGDKVPACAECDEAIREFNWINSAGRRLGYTRA